MTSESPHILVDATAPTARITISRPERHNAMDLSMWKAIPDAVTRLDGAEDVRSIILQGAGERAFVSGADISEFDEVRRDAATNHVFTQHVVRATASIRGAQTPIIAAINGHCIGGGVVLACACDIRVATEDATFAVPAARLGLGYEFENYEALARLVGHGAAAEMVLTARTYDAEEAQRIGLIQQIIPKADLHTRVEKLATNMARLAPLTLAAAKACSRAGADDNRRTAAQQAIDRCFDSKDFAEGRTAFREKRKPVFDGR